VQPLPYVKSDKTIAYGALVVKLNTASDEKLCEVDDHCAFFSGELPCDVDSKPMEWLAVDHNQIELGGIAVHHRFSRHLPGRQYKDYYELVTTYVGLICTAAEHLDHSVKARSFPVIEENADESVFMYADTASSRAEIEAITKKLAGGKIAILGVGGTGSFVLDFVAKTPVAEIHIYDGDVFSQHNAFRSPGAPDKNDLKARPQKVHYFQERYARMHRHVIPHDAFISEANIGELQQMNFVFVCFDPVVPKKLVVSKLEEWDIPFIDVGMGLNAVNDKITGIVRTTTSTNDNREIARANIPLTGDDEPNEYATNIQIADLNALNAALAVIEWKKLAGFYADLGREFCSAYTLATNAILKLDSA